MTKLVNTNKSPNGIPKKKGGRPTQERGVLGKILNMVGIDNGNVNEPPTMLADLRTAMGQELTNAGYTISQDEKAIIIKCSLKSAKCNFPVSQISEAQIRIQIVVMDQGQEVINHVYEGEGKHAPLLVGLGTNEAITTATMKVITTFIKDLEQYIKS